MAALVVNLYGGPGIGKSTLAAALFSELKFQGVNCELVTEYAKDKVWEGSLEVLGNQVYLLGKQYHKLWVLHEKVDVIVTDSPLPLLLHYGRNEGQEFINFVLHLNNKFKNMNIFLERHKEYQQAGRVETEDQARDADEKILDALDEYGISYMKRPSRKDQIGGLTYYIMRQAKLIKEFL